MREGVFIGAIPTGRSSGGTTLAANPHLKAVFGFTAEAPEADVAPFDPERFADAVARALFVGRLTNDGAVADYPLRMRRLDGSAVWIEVTARVSAASPDFLTLEALIRDVSERKKVDDQSRDFYQQLLQ